MFNKDVYVQRRSLLKKTLKKGVVIFPGNDESAMNYPANPYHFRQDSSFLYFFGLDFAGLYGVIDIDNDRDVIFGDDLSIDDVIWMGFQPTMAERAAQVGVNEVRPVAELQDYFAEVRKAKREVLFVPQYRAENVIKISKLTGIDIENINNSVSKELIKAIVEQRAVKSAEEIKEIEKALDISYLMYTEAMKKVRPGIKEKEISGMVEGIAAAHGGGLTSFPIIFSVHGETLHNHYHENVMKEGDLIVHDSGAESELHYASDITRTYPVSGKFTPHQKEIYEIVLKAQKEAIKAMKPGVSFKDVHLLSAKIIAEGLKEAGLMKGDPEDAVKAGAHALFFPHGLGHMMGLDVHDMENLGEDYVGYDETVKRSEQFGLAYLRMARKLEPGFVITVEPGIYFIPALIDMWKKENKAADFINYDKVEKYKDFGGIRIEDDVLVTEEGYRVLGKPIPKEVADIEELMKR